MWADEPLSKSKIERIIRNNRSDLAHYKKRVAQLQRELDHYENMLDLAIAGREEETYSYG